MANIQEAHKLKYMNEKIKLLLMCLFLLISVGTSHAQQTLNTPIDKSTADYNAGRYLLAGETLETTLSAYNETDVQSDDYLKTIVLLADIRLKMHAYKQAEELYIKALDLATDLYGEDSEQYMNVLNSFAKLNIEQYRIQQGVPAIHKVINYRREKNGERSLEYAESINILATAQILLQQLDKADSLAHKAADIQVEIAGKKSQPYINSLATLGNVALYKKDMQKANHYYSGHLEMCRETYGADHCQTALGSIYMSTLLGYSGKFQEAIEMLEKTIPVIAKDMGRDNMAYASILSNVGSMYLAVNTYRKSIPFLTESLEITQKHVGEKSHYYFNALNSLALAYRKLGEYEKVEPMLLKSLTIRKELYGPAHSTVYQALLNLGFFYYTINNREQAEKMYREVIRLEEKGFIAYSEAYVNACYFLGSAYMNWGKKTDDIYIYLEKARVHIEQYNQQEGSFVYAQLLPDWLWGSFNYGHITFEDFEKKYISSLDRLNAFYGKENYYYYLKLQNYGLLLFDRGEYAKAMDIFDICVSGLDELNDRHSNLYYVLKQNQGQAYWTMGEEQQAIDCLSEALLFLQQSLSRNFAFMTEREREDYSQKYVEFYSRIAAWVNIDANPRLIELLYDAELLRKALLLNSNRELLLAMDQDSTGEVTALWDKIREIRETIFQSELKHDDPSEKIKKMQVLLNEKEREFAQKLDIYEQLKQNFSRNWRDIRAMLSASEAAVECIELPCFRNDSVVGIDYYALLVRPDAHHPELVKLCSKNDLPGQKSGSEVEVYRELGQLIWQPIESYLAQIKHVYVSPVGELHRLSWNILDDKQRRYAFEDREICRLLTTKDILKAKENIIESFTRKQAMLVGGADFGFIVPDHQAAKRGQGFDYLATSGDEVKSIAKWLKKRKWDIHLYMDTEATETRFREGISAFAPTLLHISTHGYFMSETESLDHSFANSIPYESSDNPLIRSGLVLTGANVSWEEKRMDDTQNDGVLTSYEIANLDLRKTELVVLSACVTGLGDINSTEGVYGLQRAFRLAGAGNIIVSLWEVPDSYTSELMILFYKTWTNKKTVRTAFREAQLQMKAKYPDRPERWAGFVVIE